MVAKSAQTKLRTGSSMSREMLEHCQHMRGTLSGLLSRIA